MKKLLLCIVLLYSLTITGQQDFPLAKLIDSVALDQNRLETFALYLPSSYKQNELSPVVFVFDPSAQGKRALQHFIASSERYGYILIASNNSKNGPYQTNFDIANRLFTGVFNRFNIDPKRIYTSGFSGGARLASTIAVLTKSIQGVIACGSSFSKDPSHIPFEGDFSYAAIVGNTDMNYYELHNTRDFLNKLKISNELFTYAFDHRWPSSEQLLAAFDWLHLEAVKKGIVPKRGSAVEQGYHDLYQFALSQANSSKLLEAGTEYERIIRNYTPYFGLDSIRNQLKILKKKKEYQQQRRDLKNTFTEENTLLKKYADRFNSAIKNTKPSLKWWKNELEKIDNRMAKSEESERNMLIRVKNSISALAFETVTIVKPTALEKQQFCYDLVILLYPKYPYAYFKQIQLSLKNKNEDKALDYLERLINNGYRDFERIKNEKTFQMLQTNERFKRLLVTPD